MSVNKISSRARNYARYTGASRQVACDHLATLASGAPLIPAPAEHEQLLLESEVFYRVLASQSQFFEFPFGIRYVQPTTAGLRLHLESTRSLDYLLSSLLPCRMPSLIGRGEIHGLNGVRIHTRADRGIELQRLGQPTSITLAGPSHRAFEKAEADLLKRVAEEGGQPCWRAGQQWTDSERRWDAERQPLTYEPAWRGAAWLPSGLLRRLGLLHTVAAPRAVAGHESRLGDWWVLELDHFSDTALRRAELVEALTDPTNGLPLELHGHRELQPGKGLGLVLLKGQDRSGVLQLRYDRDECEPKGHEETFVAIRRRISKMHGEAQLPPLPDNQPTG